MIVDRDYFPDLIDFSAMFSTKVGKLFRGTSISLFRPTSFWETNSKWRNEEFAVNNCSKDQWSSAATIQEDLSIVVTFMIRVNVPFFFALTDTMSKRIN